MAERPTKFWHWLGPILSAVVSLIAIATVVFYTGTAAQRLDTAEEKIKKLDESAVPRNEILYRLDSVDEKLRDLNTDVKELRKRK